MTGGVSPGVGLDILFCCESMEWIMPFRRVLTGATWEKDVGYCRAVRAGDHIYVAGSAPVQVDGGVFAPRDDDEGDDYYEEEEPPRRLSLPEMLAALFEAKLAAPESIQLRGKWVAGGLAEYNGDFYKFVRARDLIKNEGLVLRHLLRLVFLAGEFHAQSGEDPDYELIRDAATEVCQQVDPSYTDRFLASQEEAKKLMPL